MRSIIYQYIFDAQTCGYVIQPRIISCMATPCWFWANENGKLKKHTAFHQIKTSVAMTRIWHLFWRCDLWFEVLQKRIDKVSLKSQLLNVFRFYTNSQQKFVELQITIQYANKKNSMLRVLRRYILSTLVFVVKKVNREL